jgi:hypothetical protein
MCGLRKTSAGAFLTQRAARDFSLDRLSRSKRAGRDAGGTLELSLVDYSYGFAFAAGDFLRPDEFDFT